MRLVILTAPAILIGLSGCAAAPSRQPAVSSAPPASPAPSADEACVVWDRENEFARSVFDHDTRAFAEHVLPGAVFVSGGEEPLRGRDAIVKAWDKIIRGDGMTFEWHPTHVFVTGDPHVALSLGPYWIAITKQGAPPRFLAGTFQSVWVKDTDGVWRVTIDGGTPDAVPVTEADVQKLKDGIPMRCPGR